MMNHSYLSPYQTWLIVQTYRRSQLQFNSNCDEKGGDKRGKFVDGRGGAGGGGGREGDGEESEKKHEKRFFYKGS